MRRIFCDMDGVLVRQTSRLRFDLMPWMQDGRELWDYIAPFKPMLLSQLREDIWDVSAHEKVIWAERELGADIPVIVVRGDRRKHVYALPGRILIDDDVNHGEGWIKAGGIFIHHRSAKQSIHQLKAFLT